MHVTTLRDSPALLLTRWQRVPVHNHDLSEIVGKDPRGQQPPHSRPDDDRPIRLLRHPQPLRPALSLPRIVVPAR